MLSHATRLPRLALVAAIVTVAAIVFSGHAAATPNPDEARVVVGPSGYYELWLRDHRLFLYDWSGRLQIATFSDGERTALIDALAHPTR